MLFILSKSCLATHKPPLDYPPIADPAPPTETRPEPVLNRLMRWHAVSVLNLFIHSSNFKEQETFVQLRFPNLEQPRPTPALVLLKYNENDARYC